MTNTVPSAQPFTRPLVDPILYRTDGPTETVRQVLELPGQSQGEGSAWSRGSPANTLSVSAGRRLYVLGNIDGGFRPLNNPYDLHNNAGQPFSDDPLANKLQGVWAQPVKALNGFVFEVDVDGKPWTLNAALTFTQSFVEGRYAYRRDDLSATRTDFVPLDQAVLLTSLTLTNDGDQPRALTIRFLAYFDLEDAWFTTLAPTRNQGEQVFQRGERVVALARSDPAAWAVVVGGAMSGARLRIVEIAGAHPGAHFEYDATLAPGAQQTWTFGVAADSHRGESGAMQTLEEGFRNATTWRTEKQIQYERLMRAGPHLKCPNEALNVAFDLARANPLLLEAEQEELGRYFYAGLENFPFWFSTDTAYSTAGLAIAGYGLPLRNALLIGARYGLAQEGRVPHQVSPSGKIAFHGNAQETPQWIISLWTYFRWTGDRDFLSAVYPAAVTGLLSYTLGRLNPAGDSFPRGPGMAERDDMGAKKLDSTVYSWAALEALGQMAAVFNDEETAARVRAHATQIESTFDAAWWDERGGTYAVSLNEPDNSLCPLPYWSVITPLEVGLATPEHAVTTLETIRSAYLNRYGLSHTAQLDDQVWTLPTAVLSRAAFRCGQPGLGLQMLEHIAETLQVGSIGLMHELIPDGLCTIQLWSSATLISGVVEDLLGIQVDAGQRRLTISPQLPSSWGVTSLHDLAFAGFRVNVSVSPGDIAVSLIEASGPLTVTLRLPSGADRTTTVRPGGTATLLA